MPGGWQISWSPTVVAGVLQQYDRSIPCDASRLGFVELWDDSAEVGGRWGGVKDLSRAYPKRTKPIIGIVGGIGAGKSVVARMLEALGAAVIDSDRLSHEELGQPEVVATLRRWWGDSVLDASGKPQRGAIAKIVFSDAAECARLEQLLYPRIERRREELLARYFVDTKVKAIALDAPKLIEAGLYELCDAVVFVDAERSVRLGRARRARGWTEAEVDRRENLQKPLDIKRAIADHVVTNHSDFDTLRSQITRVFSLILVSFA